MDDFVRTIGEDDDVDGIVSSGDEGDVLGDDDMAQGAGITLAGDDTRGAAGPAKPPRQQRGGKSGISDSKREGVNPKDRKERGRQGESKPSKRGGKRGRESEEEEDEDVEEAEGASESESESDADADSDGFLGGATAAGSDSGGDGSDQGSDGGSDDDSKEEGEEEEEEDDAAGGKRKGAKGGDEAPTKARSSTTRDAKPQPSAKKQKEKLKLKQKKADKAAVDPSSGAKDGKEGVGNDDPVAPVPTFPELHLSRPLLRAIADMGYVKPTAVQWKSIPLALAGHDVCASAMTGSGKTAAFLLPALERLLYRDRRVPAIRVLVILPTRELASQCHSVCQNLAQFTDIRSALVVGGVSLKAQEAQLRTRPDVVIGTPGRLLDHAHNSVAVYLDNVDILVLDEADRLLEMGFTEEVQEVVKACPVERQTLFFSATMTTKVEELAKFSLKKPVRVRADPLYDLASKLSQEFIRIRKTREDDREAIVLELLTTVFKTGVIVFFDRKVAAHRFKIILDLLGMRGGELHGNLTQQQRLDTFREFGDGELDVLLATDLAGRGLDMKDVQTVINFEMPRDLTTYVHRVGRTARAGRKGHAVTLTGEHRRALMKDVIKHAQDTVKLRTVEPDAISKWQEKIKGMERQIIEVYKEERMEKEARLAEMEANKASNMIEHMRDIKARPARTWFQSEGQKKALKAATQASIETKEVDLKKLSAKERKQLKREQSKAEKAAAKEAERKKALKMNRKKRRRLAAEDPGDDPELAAKLKKATRGQKGTAKALKRKARAEAVSKYR